MHRSLPWIAMAGLLFAALCGCQNSTRAARIREHPTLFAALDPFSQQLIRDGLVNFGFTPELVYMALGRPNRVDLKETNDGPVVIWTYKNFVWGNVSAMRVGADVPGAKAAGLIMSSSAPGGPSIGSTKAGPLQQTISGVDDGSVRTLFVEMFDGRVVAAHVSN